MKHKLHVNHEHTLEDLTDISASVMPIAKQILGSKGLMLAELISEWANIVGKEIAFYSCPHQISFAPS